MIRKLKKYTPTAFMAKTSQYSQPAADYAVSFIEALAHTKGSWAGKPFKLIDWQEQIIRDVFGILKPNGYRQFNTAYVEIPKRWYTSRVLNLYPYRTRPSYMRVCKIRHDYNDNVRIVSMPRGESTANH